MTDYYLDASALVKRYAEEAGSDWIRQITDPLAQNTILLAEISLAEVAAALAAKHRAPGGISREQRDRAWRIGRAARPTPRPNFMLYSHKQPYAISHATRSSAIRYRQQRRL